MMSSNGETPRDRIPRKALLATWLPSMRLPDSMVWMPSPEPSVPLTQTVLLRMWHAPKTTIPWSRLWLAVQVLMVLVFVQKMPLEFSMAVATSAGDWSLEM